MAISSMTGFARATGQDHGYRWAWSLKSVNGRGLDVRCRVPPEVDGLDVEARKRIASRFQRGSVSGVLELATDEATEQLVVNQGALEQLVEAYRSWATVRASSRRASTVSWPFVASWRRRRRRNCARPWGRNS